MDYKTLNNDHQRQLVLNRLFELEQEHYSTVLLLQEAHLIGSSDINELQDKLHYAAVRIEQYHKQFEPQDESTSDEDETTDNG